MHKVIIGMALLLTIGCAEERKTEETITDTVATPHEDIVPDDTAAPQGPAEKPDTAATEGAYGLRFGRHMLTLQWISWDQPGSVTITNSADGWYPIEGSQRNDSSYVTIKGVVKPQNEKELLFKGTIESKVPYLNGGKVCVREGEQLFKSTKGRKYWRLQNMENCEGNRVTDYVDIYFN